MFFHFFEAPRNKLIYNEPIDINKLSKWGSFEISNDIIVEPTAKLSKHHSSNSKVDIRWNISCDFRIPSDGYLVIALNNISQEDGRSNLVVKYETPTIFLDFSNEGRKYKHGDLISETRYIKEIKKKWEALPDFIDLTTTNFNIRCRKMTLLHFSNEMVPNDDINTEMALEYLYQPFEAVLTV